MLKALVGLVGARCFRREVDSAVTPLFEASGEESPSVEDAAERDPAVSGGGGSHVKPAEVGLDESLHPVVGGDQSAARKRGA